MLCSLPRQTTYTNNYSLMYMLTRAYKSEENTVAPSPHNPLVRESAEQYIGYVVIPQYCFLLQSNL